MKKANFSVLSNTDVSEKALDKILPKVSVISKSYADNTLPKDSYKSAVSVLNKAIKTLSDYENNVYAEVSDRSAYMSIASDEVSNTLLSNVITLKAQAKLVASAIQSEIEEEPTLEDVLEEGEDAVSDDNEADVNGEAVSEDGEEAVSEEKPEDEIEVIEEDDETVENPNTIPELGEEEDEGEDEEEEEEVVTTETAHYMRNEINSSSIRKALL